MKKRYMIENLECAHCAAKMEEAIKKIEGVEIVSISFLTRKLVVEGREEIFEALMEKLRKIVQKIEPDTKVREL